MQQHVVSMTEAGGGASASPRVGTVRAPTSRGHRQSPHLTWAPSEPPPQLLHVVLTFILLSLRHLADGEDCGHVHTVQYGQEDFG